MVRLIVGVMLIFLCTGNIALAQNRGFGLGVIFGERAGISFKNWVSGTTAIDGGVAWAFGDRDEFNLHADYLFHQLNWVRVQKGLLPIYYGIGGRLNFKDQARENDGNTIGIRVPVGINYIFDGIPVDLFFEAVPLFNLSPDTEFEFTIGFGGRYFF